MSVNCTSTPIVVLWEEQQKTSSLSNGLLSGVCLSFEKSVSDCLLEYSDTALHLIVRDTNLHLGRRQTRLVDARWLPMNHVFVLDQPNNGPYSTLVRQARNPAQD